jgi:hypothetical protein
MLTAKEESKSSIRPRKESSVRSLRQLSAFHEPSDGLDIHSINLLTVGSKTGPSSAASMEERRSLHAARILFPAHTKTACSGGQWSDESRDSATEDSFLKRGCILTTFSAVSPGCSSFLRQVNSPSRADVLVDVFDTLTLDAAVGVVTGKRFSCATTGFGTSRAFLGLLARANGRECGQNAAPLQEAVFCCRVSAFIRPLAT